VGAPRELPQGPRNFPRKPYCGALTWTNTPKIDRTPGVFAQLKFPHSINEAAPACFARLAAGNESITRAMRMETLSPRAGAMARWIALLAVVALALGVTIFALARGRVERATTAELSFNPDAAYLDDSTLTHNGRPAVAAAQKLLTDAVALDILHKAGHVPADGAAAVRAFRRDLDLEEPSLEALRIRYRDADPQRATAVANAVAAALEGWSPPAPARHAPKPTAPIRPAAPAPAPAVQPPDPLPAAYSALADQEGQLAAIDERLGAFASQPASADHPSYPAPLTGAQGRKRRSLVAQLATAHRKLDDLREHSAGEHSGTEATEREIADLQHELGAFPPPASGARDAGAASRGAEAERLRLERGVTTNRIAAENETIVRLREHPIEASAPAKPTSILPAPAAPAFTGSRIVETQVWQNPFRIVRLAGSASGLLAWPAVLATGISALFFAAAISGIFLYWRREARAAGEPDTAEAGTAFMLVPPMPVAELTHVAEPAAVRAEPVQEPAAAATEQIAAEAETAQAERAQGPVAAEAEAARETVAAELESTQEPVAAATEQIAAEAETARAEGAQEPVAAEAEEEWESGAREPEGEWEPEAIEAVDVREPVAAEAEEEWESGAGEPEDEWESVAREPEGEWEPVAAKPVPPAREEPEVQPTIAAQAGQNGEADTQPQEAAPALAAEVAPTTTAESAPTPAAETAPGGEPEAIPSGGKSFIDPGGGDAEWNARILQAVARSSIGQKLEAEQRREMSKRAAGNSRNGAFDADESQPPGGPRRG
jgi:hypothetical protein